MPESELFRLLHGFEDAAFTVDEQLLICSWDLAAERLFGNPSFYGPESTLFIEA